MFMLSGPVELLLEEFWMASKICLVVRVVEEGGSLLVCLSVKRFSFLVECFSVFTDCLLKEFAFC